jgi:hypothetical protein
LRLGFGLWDHLELCCWFRQLRFRGGLDEYGGLGRHFGRCFGLSTGVARLFEARHPRGVFTADLSGFARCFARCFAPAPPEEAPTLPSVAVFVRH